MLGFAAVVAGSFALGSRIAGEIDPLALTLARFVLAGALMGAAVALGGRVRRADFRAPWRYLVLGGLFAIYFVLMFEGLKTATSVSAAAVFTLTPAMSAVFGLVLLRQGVTPRIALALAIGAAGALWVIVRGDPGTLFSLGIGRGEAIYFLGCIAHALYTPLVPILSRGESAAVLTFGMIVGGAICLVPMGAGPVLATDWGALRPLVWVTLAYLSIGSGIVSFLLLQHASLRLPAAKVMAYTYLVPSFALAWEVALGGALPPTIMLGGVGLTALALVILLGAADRRR
jgi:drug/metabolite transporter (DMT)-like permease